MEFPIKFTRPPMAHQLEALSRFSNDDWAALFWEMGTGKSTEAILLARMKYLAAQDIVPTLVLSPLATLWNWEEEFKLNAPARIHEEVGIAWGSQKKKLEAFKKKIVIANYEALDSETMVTAFKTFAPKMIIADEAHALKNPKSKRFKKLLTFSDNARYRLALTGTPVLNNEMDLWGIYRFLSAGKVSPWHDFFIFRSKYFVDKNAGMPKAIYFPNWKPHATTEKELTALISAKTSRITKEECLSLPPMVRQVLHVELGAEQEKVYRQMEAELIAQVRSGECAASNALVKTLRLLQIVSGHLPVEGIDDPTRKVTHSFANVPRLTKLSELLEELAPRHKVIVWTTFRETYPVIGDILRALHLPFVDLHGDTKDRKGNIDRFQNDEDCRVMLANPQAGGVGVNLTKASYSIDYSRNFKLLEFLQSEARNHRNGCQYHEKITQIKLVARGTIDEVVLSALLNKENIADNILDRIQALR